MGVHPLTGDIIIEVHPLMGNQFGFILLMGTYGGSSSYGEYIGVYFSSCGGHIGVHSLMGDIWWFIHLLGDTLRFILFGGHIWVHLLVGGHMGFFIL